VGAVNREDVDGFLGLPLKCTVFQRKKWQLKI
jgi:hypothetical protein